MDDKMGMFGEMLEKGQQTVQNTVKSAISDVAGSVGGQLGVKNEASPDAQGNTQTQQTQQGNGQNQPQLPSEATIPQAVNSAETNELVKEFYAPSDDIGAGVSSPDSPEEQAKTQQEIAKLRQELHKGTYYDPLIAYENKKKNGEEEEGAAERV